MIVSYSNFVSNFLEPNLLNLGRSPLQIGFNSEVIANQSAVPSYVYIQVNGLPNENEYFELNGFRFYFKEFPNYNEIARLSTTTQVAQDLYNVLSQDPRLNYQYDISWTTNTNGVYVKAKQVGVQYDITFVSTASNVYLTQNVNSTNKFRGQNLSNYSIWVELFKQSNKYFGNDITNFGTVEKIDTIERDYQTNNDYYFQIEEILNKKLGCSLPIFTTDAIKKTEGWLYPFAYRFGESYSLNGQSYKRRYLVGQSFNYWICNAKKELFSSLELPNYYDNKRKAILTIELALITNNTTTVTIGGIAFTLIYSTPTATQTDLVSQINASALNTSYIATLSGDGLISVTGLDYDVALPTYTTNAPSLVEFTEQTNIYFDTVKFASNQPLSKQTNKDGFETLYFIYRKIERIEPIMYVKHFVTMFNGQTRTYNDRLRDSTADGGLYYFGLNLNNLITECETDFNTQVRTIETTVMYQFAPTEDPQPYTETITYYVNEDIEVRDSGKQNLLFENSFGTFDTVAMNGETSYKTDRDSTTYKTTLLPETTISDGITKTLSVELTDTIILSTGWIDKAHFDWLKELLESKKVYLINSELEYVNIISSNYEYDSTLDLFNITINLQHGKY